MGTINGYQLTADAYKKELDNTPEEYRAEMQAKINALEYLAGADDATIYALFDSAAFNNIVKGYIKLALTNTDTDSEKAAEIMREVSYLFSVKTAQEAEAYY